MDLPGYGYAKVSQAEKQRWSELMEGYFAQERKIALVVQICDMRHSPTKDDMTMIDFLYQTGLGSKNAQGFGMFDVIKPFE